MVQRWRGGGVESVHRGTWVVVDTSGDVIDHRGDPAQLVFARSTTKSLQALPFVETGAAEATGAGTTELAIAISSHVGSQAHTDVVQRLLREAGLDETALQCGPALPWQILGDPQPRRIANGCSGKHAAFLATAVHLGQNPSTYLDSRGSVQELVHSAVAEMAGTDGRFASAVDGCGAPTFRLPIRALATAIARMTNPESLAGGRADACRQLTAAAASHPALIAGDQRFDTAVLSVTEGRCFAKHGAEAVQVIGVVGGGIAIAAKIDDGAERGLHPLIAELLASFASVNIDEERLSRWTNRTLVNADGCPVGRIETPRAALPTPSAVGGAPR